MAIILNRKIVARSTAGFTLVEVGVVIAMMGILSAIMLPALSTAKERTRRAVCRNNLRQVYQALEMYADADEQFLPSSVDDKGYYHSLILSDETFSNLVDLASGCSNILYCPNISFGTPPTPVAQHIQNIGYVIGYSYVAESAATVVDSSKGPDYSMMPVKMPNNGTTTNELLADANYWTPAGASSTYFPAQMKVVPHTAAGAITAHNSSFTVGVPGNSVASVGAVGGNVSFADGHVQWRSLPQMQTNSASSIPNDAFGIW
ncbi:MAG TPA: type II secretion system protein [Verrucomicrobiae bacterium]|jgi:prepilin-type processing-associated H-X9-DG protein